MLSQTVEYALRAAVHLAQFSPQARTTEQIAEHTKVPKAYLSKVLQSLSRAKVVTTQRGLGGGVSLARPPLEITMLDIVNALEPLNRIKKCPLGLPMHGTHLCSLHRRLDHALAMIEGAFSNTTLAELITDTATNVPLCVLPLRRRA